MARKQHTPEQILVKLREADARLNGGSTVAAVIQHLGVGEQTYHRWRQQFGGRSGD
jgi:transposase-like protein